MKKVFLVVRTDSVGYDEFDSAVFIADNEEEVVNMIDTRKKYAYGYYDYGERKIIKVDLENETNRELINSFNAG